MHADAPNTTQDPDPQMLKTLDTKREAALSGEQDQEAEKAFWEAMFELPAWHLLAAADEEAIAKGQAPPMMTLKDGEGRVLAPVYSSSQRASDGCVKLNEQAGSEQPFSVMGLPTRNAVAYLCAVSAETPFVLIDNVPGEIRAYGNTMQAIPGWYDHLVGPCPIECFNLMSRVAAETSQGPAFYAAYRCAAAQDELYVVRTKDGQLGVANEQDKSFLPVFTTRAIAEHQTKSMGEVDIEAVSPQTLGPTDEELRGTMDESYIGVVFDPGISTLVMDPGLWDQAMQSVG